MSLFVLTILAGVHFIVPSLMAEEEFSNLVKNGGFDGDVEGKSVLAGWDLWKPDDMGTCTVDARVGYQSESSMKMAGVAQATYVYDVPVSPGEKYLVESFSRKKGTGENNMAVRWKNEEREWNWGAGEVLADYEPVEGEWGKAILTAEVPATGVSYLTVMFGARNQSTEDDAAWFDNISVRKIEEK